MKSNVTVAAVLLAALALPAVGQQTQADAFKWNNRVAAGNWVRVYNLNGRITVGAASGDNVEVVATKQWRRGDPAVVRFSADMYGQDAVICALPAVLRFSAGSSVRGTIDWPGTSRSPRPVRLACEYCDGAVVLPQISGEE